jgi:hypothetical protein
MTGMAVGSLKRYKWPGIDLIPAELFNAEGRTICSELHKFVNSVWNKEELPVQWKELVTLPIYGKGDETGCSNYWGLSLLPARQ